MIQQFNAHDFPGFLEFTGEENIIPAGGSVTAGMVMEGDDRLGVIHHDSHKDVSGFDIEFIKGAGADGGIENLARFSIPMDADNFVSGV